MLYKSLGATLFSFYLALPLNAASQQGVMVLEKNQIHATGRANYTIDPTGQLAVKGKAKAFMIGQFKFDEVYDVQPENLRSQQYTKTGNMVDFDSFTLHVTHVDHEQKLSTASGKNRKGEITFVFDISNPVVDLHRISFQSKALPIRLNLRKAF
ncbi:MAG: hypothetical protein ACOH5I_20030 [Oligoflexus sp.]